MTKDNRKKQEKSDKQISESLSITIAQIERHLEIIRSIKYEVEEMNAELDRFKKNIGIHNAERREDGETDS